MTIKGDLIHSSGGLNINRGKLIIHGDYRIQKKNTDDYANISYTYSNGYLSMKKDADHVAVYGNFIIDSNISHKYNPTAGVLELKGDFIQKSTYTNHPSDNFQASGTHKVLFSGNEKQTLTFEDPYDHCSYFNILDSVNTICGIKFTSSIIETKLFNHQRNPFILAEASVFPDYDF